MARTNLVDERPRRCVRHADADLVRGVLSVATRAPVHEEQPLPRATVDLKKVTLNPLTE